MATARKKRTSLEEELCELRSLTVGPWTSEFGERLREALSSPRSHVVARAAKIVRERALEGFGPLLVAAFHRFLKDPQKTDPGCDAKLAILEALDVIAHPDPDPFLVAARLVQKQPSWGLPVDTAAPSRARAILALANMGYRDILLLAAELLADPEAPVRQASAEALAHCGDRAAAGLLLLMSYRQEEDPVVQTSYLCGILTLAPDWGMPRLRTLLFGEDPTLRELAAIALGQSGVPEAVDLLVEFYRATPLASERAPALRGLGLHRSEKALEAVLDVVSNGTDQDAREAVKALSGRRFDKLVPERTREAAMRNSEAHLEEVLAETFPDNDA